ncbi:MAG: hypothetical protein Kow00109_07820 [Acidobacteriota bacterium]
MRYCTFSRDGITSFGIVKDSPQGPLVCDIPSLLRLFRDQGREWAGAQLMEVFDLVHWLAAGDAAGEAAEHLREHAEAGLPGVYLQRDVRLLAPIPRPGKILAVGLNYRDHAREQGVEPPDKPVLFAKFPTAVIGPYEPIKIPAESRQVDPEAELCAVLTRKVKRIRASEAPGVLAYTVGNDVSARDFQFGDRQWVRGKSCDTFAPLGPVLVTGDELGDPHDLQIELRVNEEVRQRASTREMIFNCFELVEYFSRTTTLEPGDVLFTGTPAGVGVFRDPPVFLAPGDFVEVEIEGIGTLKNPVAADLPA